MLCLLILFYSLCVLTVYASQLVDSDIVSGSWGQWTGGTFHLSYIPTLVNNFDKSYCLLTTKLPCCVN